MLIYNLTIKADNDVSDQWLEWMKQVLIPVMLDTGLFHNYHLGRLLEPDIDEGPTFVLQFFCDSMADYQTYLAMDALTIQKKIHNTFGNKVVFFQTVMEIL